MANEHRESRRICIYNLNWIGCRTSPDLTPLEPAGVSAAVVIGVDCSDGARDNKCLREVANF